MTKTQQYLEKLDACQEACEWVGSMDLQDAWQACTRLDWLQWLLRAPINAAYRAQRAPIDAAYRAQLALIDEAYEAQRAPIDEAYEAQRAPIDEAYEAQRAPIYAAYWAQRAPIDACETCDDLRAAFACPVVN